MSRFANDTRFGTDAGADGTWYSPRLPRTIAELDRWPQYRQRAAWLHAEYPTGRIGIAGTGMAFTQYWLFVDHARQSWGCDVAWAITRAGGLLGAWANFVASYDVLNATQMGTNFRRLGNTGQGKYTVIFTEDLMPAMESEAEVATARTNLLLAGTTLVHLISPLDTTTTQTTDMLWRSKNQWRQLLSNDRIVGPNLVDWA